MATPNKPDLLHRLQERMILGDGAMATQLYRLGIPVGVCYEELNVSNPDVVARVHRSYYEAGARLLETNTFGAHRAGLARYGLEEEVAAINRAAVRVARAESGPDAYVVGTVGSVKGVRRNMAPPIDLRRAYAEQIGALLEETPDGILLETFLDLDELMLALEVARSLTSGPVMAQLSLVDLSVTRDGTPVGEAFRRLLDAGADVVGLNCRFGPADMRRALLGADLPAGALLSVYPNAGLLSLIDGKYEYPSEPAYFAAAAQEFRALGVRVAGGCCGTSPEHIRAMAGAVSDLPPSPLPDSSLRPSPEDASPRFGAARGLSVRPRFEGNAKEAPERERAANSGDPAQAAAVFPTVLERVRTRHAVIVELDPPKDLAVDRFLEGAQELQAAGAAAVTLADNSLAVTRVSNMALGALMKRKGIEPLLHISGRDRNLIGLQSHLMGLHALGIRQILVVTGDPSRFGDLPGATSVFDASSFDMIRMVKQLNSGVAFSGRTLSERSSFVVGAAFNPHVAHLDKAVRRLERKAEAGADFAMTQPIYDPRMFETLKEATRHLNIPVFVGIMPLLSSRNAEFLHNEVPGIRLTDDARRRMAAHEGARAREEGVAIARELIDAALPHFRGVYLITPMLRYEMTATLTRYALRRASEL